MYKSQRYLLKNATSFCSNPIYAYKTNSFDPSFLASTNSNLHHPTPRIPWNPRNTCHPPPQHRLPCYKFYNLEYQNSLPRSIDSSDGRLEIVQIDVAQTETIQAPFEWRRCLRYDRLDYSTSASVITGTELYSNYIVHGQ